MKASRAAAVNAKVWTRTFWVLLGLVVLVLGIQGGLMLFVPGPWSSGDGGAMLLIAVVVSAPVAYFVHRVLLRRADRTIGRTGTPAASWAWSNGWRYRAADEDLDDAVAQAVVGDEWTIDTVLDEVYGTWHDRPTWGFAYQAADNDGNEIAGDAVVTQVRAAWTGRLTLSRAGERTPHAAARLAGWDVSGAISGRDAAGIAELLSDTGLAGGLAARTLPADARLQAYAEVAGAYVALVAPWSDEPDRTLPSALTLLDAVATALEAYQPGRSPQSD